MDADHEANQKKGTGPSDIVELGRRRSGGPMVSGAGARHFGFTKGPGTAAGALQLSPEGSSHVLTEGAGQ